MNIQVKALLTEYDNLLVSIHGVYLSTKGGLKLIVNELESVENEQIRQIQILEPQKANVAYVDSLPCGFFDGDPNLNNANELFGCTQGEYKQRHSENGVNSLLIGQLCLVMIYQYWEDSYRGRIASELKVSKDVIISEVMGDMNLLRRSIIHHQGVATKEVDRCQILKWFKTGDSVFINEPKFNMMVSKIRELVTLNPNFPSI
jgi:hypothetical protein